MINIDMVNRMMNLAIRLLIAIVERFVFDKYCMDENPECFSVSILRWISRIPVITEAMAMMRAYK